MQKSVASRFGAKSTAEDVIEGLDLRGQLAVVTGASVGLGKETARVLAKAGADVFLGARRREAIHEFAVEINATCGENRAHIHPLDLMSLASIDAFADAVLALKRPVNMLINNAGIMMCPQDYNTFGIESQFAVNCVGHAVLTSRLARSLVEARRSRLVSLTSTAHQMSGVLFDDINFRRRSYDRVLAYAQSKSADSLLAMYVSDKIAAEGVTALAVHPGMIATELLRFLTPDDLQEMSNASGLGTLGPDAFKTIQAGAATSVWAATAPALTDLGPLYLEDCHVAPIIDAPNMLYGVMRHALDAAAGDRLWKTVENMIARKLPL